jgi:hypothetical protein
LKNIKSLKISAYDNNSYNTERMDNRASIQYKNKGVNDSTNGKIANTRLNGSYKIEGKVVPSLIQISDMGLN